MAYGEQASTGQPLYAGDSSPKPQASLTSNIGLAKELCGSLIAVLEDVRATADTMDGPIPENKPNNNVAPVPRGHSEQLEETLRECASILGAIRPQLDRIKSRV